MSFFYNVAIYVFKYAMFSIQIFNPKVKNRFDGLKKQKIELHKSNNEVDFWFHCASLGEFEQVNFLIQKIKDEFSEKKILLTFFSPSGYEQKKDYKFADFIHYIPFDTESDMKKFVSIFNPKLVFWVRYEFWKNCITILNDKKTPIILLNGVFRMKVRPVYKLYLSQVLPKFNKIFTINSNSQSILKTTYQINSEVISDTRYDRMNQVAKASFSDKNIEKFINNQKVLICGSTWSKDEILISQVQKSLSDYKLIIIPHDVSTERIVEVKSTFKNAINYSEFEKYNDESVLIIDAVGLLSKIYRYADVVYVGGGFDKVVHSLIEPLAYYKSIIIGQNIDKSEEAISFVNNKIAQQIYDSYEFIKAVKYHENTDRKEELKRYFNSKIGSTDKIISIVKKMYEI